MTYFQVQSEGASKCRLHWMGPATVWTVLHPKKNRLLIQPKLKLQTLTDTQGYNQTYNLYTPVHYVLPHLQSPILGSQS